MKLVVVLICCIFSPCLIFADKQYDAIWSRYKKKYKKNYSPEEEAERRLNFEENSRLIKEHNLRAKHGMASYRLDVNHLADLSREEAVAYTNCVTGPDLGPIVDAHLVTRSEKPLPKRVDWRKRKAVTRIKSQGECGSCWAFATTGAVEGQVKRKTGRLVSLSEQNLIDCAQPDGGEGCDGGTMTSGYEYIIRKGGIDTEKSYPYMGEEGNCHFNRSNIGARIKAFHLIHGAEEVIKEAVATIGPVSTVIDASRHSFMYYRNGIYYSNHCNAENTNHAVLIVGYGEKDGRKYWIIKNSWSTSWGQKGYMKIERDSPNMCGIGKYAAYPII